MHAHGAATADRICGRPLPRHGTRERAQADLPRRERPAAVPRAAGGGGAEPSAAGARLCPDAQPFSPVGGDARGQPCPRDGQLSACYTQDFNRRHQRSGHLFQGRYQAILVEKDSYLLELSRYIHLNPVRVGEVSQAWAFPWSSAAAYVGKATMLKFLTVGEVLARFGRGRAVARRRYAAFLAEGVARPGETPWERVVGQVLLGGPAWTERVKRRVARTGAAADTVAIKALRPRPGLSVVLTQVCRAAKVEREAILRARGDRGGWARPVAMALAWDVCGLGQREIGRQFGVGPHAVSKAMVRTAALRRGGGKVGRALKRLTSTFKG